MDNSVLQALEADHQELDALLARTDAAIENAEPVAVFESMDLFWARLAMHIRAEHIRLFPALRGVFSEASDADRLDAMLAALRVDHDFFMVELARAIKAVRLIFPFGNETETFAVVRDILDRVKERLASHNRMEEEELYPLAAEPYFSAASLRDLSAGIAHELSNFPARYKDRGDRR